MVTTVIIAIVCFAVGGGLSYMLFRYGLKSKYDIIIKEAQTEAEVIKKNKLLEVKEKFLNKKADLEKEVALRNQKIQQAENKLKQRELMLNQKQEEVQRKRTEAEAIKENLEAQIVIVDKKKEELDKLQMQEREKLEALMIDATYLPVRRGDSVSKEAFFVVMSLDADGRRDIVGVYNNPTEGSGIWNAFFEDLKSRGLEKVGLIVSDGLNNIEEVAERHFSGVEVQLCSVHLQREICNRVRPKDKRAISSKLSEVFRKNDPKRTVEDTRIYRVEYGIET